MLMIHGIRVQSSHMHFLPSPPLPPLPSPPLPSHPLPSPPLPSPPLPSLPSPPLPSPPLPSPPLPSYSYATDCVPCDAHSSKVNWIYYLLAIYVPLLVIFLVIIVFNIHLTSGPLNSFILFAQVISTTVDINLQGLAPLNLVYGLGTSAFEKSVIRNSLQFVQPQPVADLGICELWGVRRGPKSSQGVWGSAVSSPQRGLPPTNFLQFRTFLWLLLYTLETLSQQIQGTVAMIITGIHEHNNNANLKIPTQFALITSLIVFTKLLLIWHFYTMFYLIYI